MHWSLELSTAPASEPTTLTEAKAHCRVDTTDDDTYLTTLIGVARQAVEGRTSLALLQQTRKVKLENWPRSGRIYLPRPPLQSVTSIAYLDSAGAAQTLSSALYQVVGAQGATPLDPEPPVAYIQPAFGQSWPSVYGTPECITVTYVCGWASAGAVPTKIKQALLVVLADLYEQREVTMTGTIAELPTVANLLASHRAQWHDDWNAC